MDSGDYSVHYRQWHSEAPEHVARIVEQERARLEGLLAGVPRGRAIDLGSGMGFTVLALHDLGFDAYGVERDAGQVAASERLGVPTVHSGDLIGSLNAKGEPFKVVTLLDVLEHLPRDAHIPVLQAAHDRLEPDGVLVVAVPNAASPVATYFRYIDWTHEMAFTITSLRYVLLNAGFEQLHFVGAFDRVPRPSLRLWRADVRSAFRRWLLRRLWRAVIRAELEHDAEAQEMPIDLNLVCVARP